MTFHPHPNLPHQGGGGDEPSPLVREENEAGFVPLYEYRCDACSAVAQVLTRTLSEEPHPACKRCGGTGMTRLISRVARVRTAQEAWDASGTPGAPGGDYYRDPRNIGRKVEEDFQRYGVDVPREVREKIDAARDGNAPKELDL